MSDDFDDPALTVRNPVEGKCFKHARRLVGNKKGAATYVKRRAHKKARKDAKAALNGERSRAKARPGSGWEVA